MPNINIAIRNKYAIAAENTPNIVCDNSDYTITFDFDAEWDNHDIKTARFEVGNDCYDEVFSGNVVEVPIVSKVRYIKVGVYAGELHTTAPVVLACEESILSGEGVPSDPPESVYAQIAEMLNATSAKVEQTENGAVISIEDHHGKTKAVVNHGKDGYTPIKGEDYFDGIDGKGIFYVENANANLLTDPGIYFCYGTKKNFPIDVDNARSEVFLFVQNRVNTAVESDISQTVFYTAEGYGRINIYSRAFDNLVNVDWTEWVNGVLLPRKSITDSELADGAVGTNTLTNGAVTGEKLSDDIPLSKFVNDGGYIPKKRYKKLDTKILNNEILNYEFSTPMERVYFKISTETDTQITLIEFYGSCGGTKICFQSLPAASAGKKWACIEMCPEFGYWRSRGSAWVVGNSNSSVNTYARGNDHARYLNYSDITYSGLTSISSSSALPEGTKIEIWGIEADPYSVATLDENEL